MKANYSYPFEESQRELAAGVLKQAAEDLRRFHNATSRVERELYYEAYSWVMSDDYFWPFSFQNVCHILNHAPEELRQELIGDLPFGPSVSGPAAVAAPFVAFQIISERLQALLLSHTHQAC